MGWNVDRNREVDAPKDNAAIGGRRSQGHLDTPAAMHADANGACHRLQGALGKHDAIVGSTPSNRAAAHGNGFPLIPNEDNIVKMTYESILSKFKRMSVGSPLTVLVRKAPMHVSADTTYRHVQGLSRGLDILRALNASGPGGASPRQLSETTHLHRTTVKRLLETLVEQGYLRPCDCEGHYGLTPEVLALSSGLTEDAHVLCQASRVLKELAEDTGWSLRISTLQTDCVVIRDSSHHYSRLSFEPWGGLNRRLPMLLTAAGRACFAYSSDAARQRTVEILRGRPDEQSAIARDEKLLQQLTRRVLDDGYALNDGDWGDRRLGGVGLPIRSRGGDVLASMSMLYTRRPVTRQVIANEFVPALRASVARVEALL